MKSGVEPFFYLFGIAAVSAAVSLLLLWHWRSKLPLAHPNRRSLHQTPVPRVAALALWAGFVAGLITMFFLRQTQEQFLMPFIGLLALAAISFWDDCANVAPFYRFLVQITVAGLLVCGWLAEIQEGNFLVFAYAFIGIFLVVWMTNLFNFMDGSDGLAITMTVIGFSALAAAALLSELSWWWLPALVVAAALPLWCVNFPTAKMFLGDVGAIPLGFLAAAFGGMGIVQKQWSIVFVLLVFLPFVFDATLTLLCRLWRREKVWQAHRTHFYQRLAQTGAGHLGTLVVYGVLMMGCALTAVLLFRQSEALLLALMIWVIIHLGLFAAIHRYDMTK